jgi:hypothetical protein
MVQGRWKRSVSLAEILSGRILSASPLASHKTAMRHVLLLKRHEACHGQPEMAVPLRGDGGACFQYGAGEAVPAGRGTLTGSAGTQEIPAHLIGKRESVLILTGADLL